MSFRSLTRNGRTRRVVTQTFATTTHIGGRQLTVTASMKRACICSASQDACLPPKHAPAFCLARRIAEGQALCIKVRPPPCRCWNFQLNNHWMESLDYRYHPVHTNNTLARADDAEADAYTIIVAHADPNTDGIFRGNWISTVGHACGTMCFRFVAPKVVDAELPHPHVSLVPFEALIACSA